jgi:hypothetical protein
MKVVKNRIQTNFTQMQFQSIKKLLCELMPSQLWNLDSWIHERLLAEGLSKNSVSHAPAISVKERRVSNKTYRFEGVRCGKEICKCAEGKLHGPYWYAYWSEDGRTRSRYIGKQLPRGVKLARVSGVR